MICKTNILKRNTFSQKFIPKEVSFIEFNKNSVEDLNTLKKLKKRWPLTFASNIFREFTLIGDAVKVYALTLQEKNFEKLDADDILGLAEISNEESEVTLEALQTKPKYMYNDKNQNSLYKSIGTTLLNSIKNISYIKRIKVHSLFSVIPFYEKNEFKNIDENNSLLTWIKK